MVRAIFSVAVALMPSWAFCLDAGLPELPSFASVKEQVFAQSERLRVNMDVRGWFEGERYDVRDTFAKIDLEVSRGYGGKEFRFSGSVDGRSFNGRVEKRSDGSWEIWGGGLSVTLRQRGASDYEISGYINEDQPNGSRHIDIDLRQWGSPGSFSIFETGVSIDVRKFGSAASLTGDVELERFGRKSLAVLGVFVAVIESGFDAPKAPANKK
ncbi:MAG: hypothetical protein HZB91_09240 [Elusimicrobia bacterium]|nr:hypothetical protein [Elusimicrobiota bacterium]